MSTPTYTLADIIQGGINFFVNMFGEIMTVLQENVSAIATLVVLGGIAFAIWRWGRRLFSQLSGMLRAIF